MSIKEFFSPFIKAKPWEITLCIVLGCIAIFYAHYAPSIWAALLVFLLWYCFVLFMFIVIKHLLKKNNKQ
jgi:Flp pilus assembly protein TadB